MNVLKSYENQMVHNEEIEELTDEDEVGKTVKFYQ